MELRPLMDPDAFTAEDPPSQVPATMGEWAEEPTEEKNSFYHIIIMAMLYLFTFITIMYVPMLESLDSWGQVMY